MLGAGGHAKVILDIAKLTGIKITHIVDIKEKLDPLFYGLKHITSDNNITNNLHPKESYCINALGVIPGKSKLLRSTIYAKYIRNNYIFIKMIHPSAIISPNVTVESGVNIMAGAIIQTGSIIKQNSIINTGVLIDHDCQIEKDVHIAPGAVLCGNVKVGKKTFIGAGAKVLPNTIIPNNSIIPAGSLLK